MVPSQQSNTVRPPGLQHHQPYGGIVTIKFNYNKIIIGKSIIQCVYIICTTQYSPLVQYTVLYT